MRNLTIVLGAGFSRNCGFPLAFDINYKFSNLDIENLLNFSSGEWKWDEHSEVDSQNGRLTSDRLGLSMLLKSYIESFKNECKKPFDYEEFLDWFLEKGSDIELLQSFIDRINDEIKEKYNFKEGDFHYLGSSAECVYRGRLYECYNELIADLLWREYEIKNNRIDYFGLLCCFFLMFKEKYIFTLNHDLLLDDLFHYYNKEYSDGFTANNSPLIGDDNENIEIFNNNYDKEIKVFKLHGSIDYYKYDYFIKEGPYYNPTGEYVFFKPKTYHNKHVAKRIDLESGSVLQSLTVNITPQFLTGKNKPDIIKKLTFYESLFKNFNEVLKTTTDLMIIGYSFKDNHINDMLGQAAQNGTLKNIYNINKSNTDFFEKCGFVKNYFYYDNITSF